MKFRNIISAPSHSSGGRKKEKKVEINAQFPTYQGFFSFLKKKLIKSCQH